MLLAKRDWLIELRKEKNMKQREVAEMTKFSRPQYANIELGIRNPSVHGAKQLGLILGFDWTRIFE